jgi:zinc-ribbon domain/Sel1 repeat
MLETMYVRCTHCGYDNSPEYRFCGMCGASLAHPPVATTATTAAKEPAKVESAGASALPAGNGNGSTETVHGPSFLGLAEDPKTEFHYLYEDEPPRSYAGVVFVLILLIGTGGFGYWQWKHNGFPFNRLNTENKPAQTASPSEVAPAQTQDQQTKIDKPMTGAGDVLPTAPDQNAKPPDTGKASEFPPQGGQNAAPEGSAAKTPEQNAAADKTQEATEEAKATPPADVPEKAAKAHNRTLAPKAKAPAPAPAAAATPASPDADLELAGERYLYGNGLPQNCTRAESSLRTAATHGNSKAQTVLGTMYATGHCVGRDLPTAYRWFARALHQEPQNSRISADLQVLWRQMTPQEKQLATSSGQ